MKRKPFQPMIKSRSLTGCERERSKQNISWIISLSKNDTEKILAKLTETPGLASIICHLTGLAPLHWAVRHNNKKLVQALLRWIGEIEGKYLTFIEVVWWQKVFMKVLWQLTISKFVFGSLHTYLFSLYAISKFHMLSPFIYSTDKVKYLSF